jgi:hypothetical protein
MSRIKVERSEINPNMAQALYRNCLNLLQIHGSIDSATFPDDPDCVVTCSRVMSSQEIWEVCASVSRTDFEAVRQLPEGTELMLLLWGDKPEFYSLMPKGAGRISGGALHTVPVTTTHHYSRLRRYSQAIRRHYL